MPISFGLALLALRKPDGMLDKSVRLVTMLGTGIPVFWLGMGLQFIFSTSWVGFRSVLAFR